MASSGADPRLDMEASARPLVARSQRGVPAWMFIAGIVLAGVVLFAFLNAQRLQMSAPATKPRFADLAGVPSSVQPLYVPPLPPPAALITPVAQPKPQPTPRPVPTPEPPRIIYVPPSAPQPVAPAPAQRSAVSPVLVMDTTVGDAGSAATAPAGGETGNAAAAGAAVATTDGGRARASVMRNRATTVPQGTLIAAVLEGALDSTRAGPARALVTRDVKGFDGSKVLIPKGSRLIGEYKADLQAGQNRALVIWTRLVRPDGATIALASPSADPLGRVGIKGKVNSHFLERFASALLQTSLNVGTGLAARAAGGDSIAVLTLPGALTGGGSSSPLLNESQIQPTLRVKQGVSISVFVARDLDFTAVESRK